MADDSQSRSPREESVEDARTLAETLEEANPDPHMKHGGRVHFHRRLEELLRAIPEGGESVEGFYERIAGFGTGMPASVPRIVRERNRR